MALFKISRGSETNLPVGITDGYAYFCTDNQNFYIDFVDNSGVATRKKLGVEYAEKLRYSKDGKYVEINPTDIALLSANNIFTGNNIFTATNTFNGTTTFSASENTAVQFPVGFVVNGSCNFDGHHLHNIGDPSVDADGANKKYVDNTVNASKLTWKGEWSLKQDYVVNDLVQREGSCYICIQNATGINIPGTDTFYWQLLASKGDTGIQGQKGDTGAKGADGSKQPQKPSLTLLKSI